MRYASSRKGIQKGWGGTHNRMLPLRCPDELVVPEVSGLEAVCAWAVLHTPPADGDLPGRDTQQAGNAITKDETRAWDGAAEALACGYG